MQNLIDGLTALASVSAVLYLLAGAVIGVVVGVIPGLSAPVVLSAILIFADYLSVTATLCLFLGALCGGFYSASVSAILLNTPAHPEAFPITFDGYPMARNGQPGRALGLSAASTCVGGLIGCAVLAVLLPFMDDLSTVFHPPEYLALVTLALLLIGALHTDSIGKTIVASGTGLILASIGPSAITGTYRFTFNHVELAGGISLIALVLGIFAVPQMVLVFGTGTASAREDMNGHVVEDAPEKVEIVGNYAQQVLGGVRESFRRWAVLLQGGLVGAVTGMIPGIGAFTGNYMAYGIARQLSKKRDTFGTGNPDGIIAPEGSSLAKEAGHIIPIIGLGIPGGAVGALFIGALSLKGMRIGQGFQSTYPGVTGQIVWIIAITGVVGTIIGVLMGSQIVKITRVPGPIIVPFIFVLCVIGPYFTDATFFPVVQVLLFAVVGLVFRRLGYPVGCFVIGLVLGPTFETNLYLTRSIFPGVSFLAHRPIATVIFLLALLVVVSKTVEVQRAARKRRAALLDEVADAGGEGSRTELRRRVRSELTSRHPVLQLATTPVLLAVGVFVAVYGATHYEFLTAAMPVIGGICVAVPSLLSLPGDVQRFVRYWRVRSATGPVERGIPVPAPVLVPAGGVPADDGATAAAQAGSGTPLSATAAVPSSSWRGWVAGTGGAEYAAAHPITDRSWGRRGQYRRELASLVWLCALVLLCWLIGFQTATAIWVALYGFFCTRRYFRTVLGRVAFAALASGLMYTITYQMFTLAFVTFTPALFNF